MQERLKAGARGGFGYTGIISSPSLASCAPSALLYAVEAILLLFYLAGWAAAGLRLRRAVHA